MHLQSEKIFPHPSLRPPRLPGLPAENPHYKILATPLGLISFNEKFIIHAVDG
jgi:hypothetical protein